MEKPEGPVRQGINAYRRILGKGHTEMPQGFEKIPGPPPAAPLRPETGESKYRRVAKFLILTGGDEAARILANLGPDQVEAISQEIAGIRGITAEEAKTVLAEFHSLLDTSYGYSGGSLGGVETARRLLYAAFGPHQGEVLLRKALPQEKEEPFDFLEDFSGEQVALLLRDESPAAAAMILSRLPPQLSARALANMSPDRKLETVRRIAKLGQVSPEILDRTAAALREKARKLGQTGGQGGETLDGMGTLAAILKHTDVSFGDQILSELAWDAPDIGRDLKERLHTLDDVVKAEDRPLAEKLRDMSEREIALLLRGRSVAFAEKILSNVSANRRILVREEDEVMGPVPKADVEALAREFLTWFRQGRERGKILLIDDEDVIL
ncbi:MAG: flagellar motor switch protein FliG [Treponema sp.]|jgi:flagellar motor switch protein FliG|nr:flagellar motor switch protein FliG [Treponema sp.]